MQKAFLNFVVTPTWELLRDVAPKSHALARALIDTNLAKWVELAERGDATAVLNEGDARAPAAALHVAPIHSPFHSNNQTSWCGPYVLVSSPGSAGACAAIQQRGPCVAWGVCRNLCCGGYRGNADMLLLLLNDENNEILGEGLRLIAVRDQEQRAAAPAAAQQ